MKLFSMFWSGILWSALWMVAIAMALQWFPFLLEHDYPPEERAVANLKAPTVTEKRYGLLFAVLSMLLLFALLFLFGFWAYQGETVPFWQLFLYLWGICMCWNIVDLVVVDWILICRLSCPYFMLPGTSSDVGTKHYRFHFNGFLKGIITMSVVAVIVSVLVYITVSR